MAKNLSSRKYEGVRYKNLSDGDVAYYIRFTKDGKRYEKKVGTKFGGYSEKKAYNKKIEMEHSEKIDDKSIKFREVADRLLEIKKIHLRKKSFLTICGVRKHLEYLDDRYIDSINQKDINDMIISLKNKMANSSINRIISTLKAVLEFANTEYGIKAQKLSIQKLKTNDNRERFLSKEEILALKIALNSHYEHLLFVNLALCTGARLMSILDIRKKDIDLKNKTIKLRDFKNPSTYQGYLNDEVKELLLKKWDNLKDDDKVIQKSKRLITEKLQGILNHLFNQNSPENKQKVVIHSLRHTFASHLAIGNTPIQIIQKLLNHKDIHMTMRYSHLMPDSGKEWVDKIWN
ncbi:tyrosine-type recombinase/integrase [Helicobacter cappadocius]|uniref:Site-specific integrase n=1 Tax=Helicobacter cappadocius TaxID=3063998 RepID=A0AA90PT30_9HELI|nr:MULTISPECIES: site-specific integrase [unclassified Helicobacter]MDO7253768.1 site-specific integrase [Helicobacter sp. faydin-H75]MDP2539697.1 site-specific integrase [Helicobacter sp. faydin-H76]